MALRSQGLLAEVVQAVEADVGEEAATPGLARLPAACKAGKEAMVSKRSCAFQGTEAFPVQFKLSGS